MDPHPDEADTEKEELIRRADGAYFSPPTFVEFMQTADVELGPWERARAELDQARADAPADAEMGSIKYLLRAAAVETGAIEGLYTTNRGFTFSVAEDVLAIEQLAVEKGEDFVRLFDAQLASFEMALDAATNAVPLSESWLRQLHEVTTAGQEAYRVVTPHGVQERPLPRGAYKVDPNHVLLKDGGVHSYSPVAETAREVRRVIEQLRTDDFEAADAVHQAAYAHYALVAVHPFSDGNGRVVRALASVFLLRAASVPLFIYSDQTADYFDALAASDAGNHEPFTRFVRGRAIAVARTASDALGRTTVDRSDLTRLQTASMLRRLDSAVDDQATSIAMRLRDHLRTSIEDADLPGLLTVTADVEQGAVLAPAAGWRVRPNNGTDLVVVRADADIGAKTSSMWTAHVQVATEGDLSEAYRLMVPGRDPLMIASDEVFPEITHELDLRLQAVAGRALSGLVRDLSAQVEDRRR